MSTPASHRRPYASVLMASLTGTSLEWYDFFLYSTAAALIFGDVFFPASDPAVGTLLSLATFGGRLRRAARRRRVLRGVRRPARP